MLCDAVGTMHLGNVFPGVEAVRISQGQFLPSHAGAKALKRCLLTPSADSSAKPSVSKDFFHF